MRRHTAHGKTEPVFFEGRTPIESGAIGRELPRSLRKQGLRLLDALHGRLQFFCFHLGFVERSFGPLQPFFATAPIRRGGEHGPLNPAVDRRLNSAMWRIHEPAMQNSHNPDAALEVLPRVTPAGIFAINQIKHFNVATPNGFAVGGLFKNKDSLTVIRLAAASQFNRLLEFRYIFGIKGHGYSTRFLSINHAESGISKSRAKSGQNVKIAVALMQIALAAMQIT